MKKSTGNRGEKLACKYIKKHAMKILETNYRALRGEIDIIAQEDCRIVFIEVKTNNAGSGVPPELRVNPAKQRQIGKIAQAYLQKTGKYGIDCRFDVIGVILHDKGKHEITHIRDAFWLQGNI
ncbi:hypothetical protein AMJ80_09930 [bacterium SM23_31]|nr:MAG: hypothetical protein AMJ80_09930 [bacterium SM23_31]